MPIENARIECLAKPITHAFIYFKRDDERRKIPSEKSGVRRILYCQIVVKTCQSGSLKYIKYQDIETEVQRRRDEGKTTSSQMHTATQENQGINRGTSEGGGRDKLKKN